MRACHGFPMVVYLWQKASDDPARFKDTTNTQLSWLTLSGIEQF